MSYWEAAEAGLSDIDTAFARLAAFVKRTRKK